MESSDHPWGDYKARVKAALAAIGPPPKLTVSEWADQHFYLSAESAAEPGRWRTLPYQKGILDAFSDPSVEQISVMKSARVGFTKCLNAVIGYHIDQNPCPILVVQPTVDDAKQYSKEEIAPMLRDCPKLTTLILEEAADSGPRDSANTILHKRYPGGVLSMVGANSGAGFRRVSRKIVLFDEVDGYPPSAGSDGDQIKLGIMRSQYYHDRKIMAGSTPLVSGASRIERLYLSGDQRRYYVPCPQCSHMAPLVFTGKDGHAMSWPSGKPEEAIFVCQQNGCVIEHKDKREMVARGEWRASAPFSKHASFHIWAAYSFAPNASWGQLAAEFLDAKENPETLKTFVNTVLGETWKERGDAPDWKRLYDRRESYPIHSVPDGVLFLTGGVDVQKDRVVYEIVGWGPDKESWSIDSGVIPMDTSNEADWLKLDDLLNRTYSAPNGKLMTVLMLAVDSGYNTQMVYNWCRRHPMSRVIAIKGVSTAKVLISSPTAVDVNHNGKRFSKGYKVWPIGVDIAKAELYGWLKLPIPADGVTFPGGFCHFPEYGEDFFRQLTAEHLVSRVNERTKFTIYEWQLIPGRENHFLDARIYARAAAGVAGIDRIKPKIPAPEAPAEAVVTLGSADPAPKPAPHPGQKSENWLSSDSRFQNSRRRGKSWLSRGR